MIFLADFKYLAVGSALFGYLCGSIPFGLLLAKYCCGIDPRLGGSRNIGATNIARLCGRTWGAATLICDAAKGAVPVLCLRFFINMEGGTALAETTLPLLVGFFAVLGHMFPIWLRCKGGKGVATTVGVFGALAPVELVLAGILCLGVIWRTGFVSAGSLVLSFSLPLLLFARGKNAIALAAVFLSFGIVLAHKGNIKRLLAGTEKSWRKK